MLYNLVEALRLVAHTCAPFLPAAAEGIARQIGIALDAAEDWTAWGRYPAGTAVQPGGVLFPKLEMPAV